VLGRVPTGSAFAALPLAALLTAAAQNWWWLVAFSGSVFAGSMVWTFAPWIPGVKERLPASRRRRELQRFWLEGHELLNKVRVTSDKECATWMRATAYWERDTSEWLAREISPVEAELFLHPKVVAHSVSGSFNPAHNDARNAIAHQLPQLVRLRDEQERSLK
jgi:hypothetical protein